MARKRSRISDAYERTSSNPFPYVTEDGMTWRDAITGEPAPLDEKGRLIKPFRLELVTGAHETWAAGMTIPPTPDAWDKMVDEMLAQRSGKATS